MKIKLNNYKEFFNLKSNKPVILITKLMNIQEKVKKMMNKLDF